MMMGKQVRENAQHNSLPTSTNDQFGPRPFASPGLRHEALDQEAHFGHNFGGIDLLPIQPKLVVGPSDDKYEQEADQVADAVMRMPESQAVSSGARFIQGNCPTCEEDELRRQPIEEEELKFLQPKEISGQNAETTPALESSINAIRGGGQPLSESERAFFEPRFGFDFSQVRVHANTQAAESARAVNARAYTVGRDVVFGTGQYVPGTTEGQRLLAHELTHVIQQSQSRPTVKQIMSAPSKIKQNNIFTRKAKAHTTQLPMGCTASIVHRQIRPCVVHLQRTTFAFYTTGDTRTLVGCPGLTISDMYQAYARSAASQVFGVGTDSDALSRVSSLPPNSVNRALFVGHGNATDGYFFSGTPSGANNFISSLPNMFDSADTNLMNALERVLLRQGANVEFHACYVGASPLVGALQSILNTARYQTGNIVNIMAYSGRSVLHPNVQNCRITGFQPPPQGTTWQAGRIPRRPRRP